MKNLALIVVAIIATTILMIALMIAFNKDFRDFLLEVNLKGSMGSYSFSIGKTQMVEDSIPKREVEANYTRNSEVEANYTRNSEVEANYTRNSEVEANYTRNSEVEANYTRNSEVADNYTRNSEVAGNYIRKSEVSDNYIRKSEVADNYTRNSEVVGNYIRKSEVADNYIRNSEVADNYTRNSEVAGNYIRNSEVADNYIRKSEVGGYVESMDRDDDQAKRIREIQVQKRGPWELPESEELIVTVPGIVEEGSAHVCKKHYGKKYTLYANHKRYADRKKAVTVNANKYIINTKDCSQRTGDHGMQIYDMQISCADATSIFPDVITECRKIMQVPCADERLLFLDETEKQECETFMRFSCDDVTLSTFPGKKCEDSPQWNTNNVLWKVRPDASEPLDPKTGRLKVLAIPISQ